jgi:hypothetical protein
MLKQAKAEGTRGQLSGRDATGRVTIAPPENRAPSFAAQGISKRQASDWQHGHAYRAANIRERHSGPICALSGQKSPQSRCGPTGDEAEPHRQPKWHPTPLRCACNQCSSPRVAQNFEAERKAQEIRVHAERRAGELLKAMPKAKPSGGDRKSAEYQASRESRLEPQPGTLHGLGFFRADRNGRLSRNSCSSAWWKQPISQGGVIR